MKTPKTNANESQDEFPGYPHYPAEEDIVRRAKRVNMNLDEEDPTAASPSSEAADKRQGDAAGDVTREDLKALNSNDYDAEGEDAVLLDRVYPVDFTGQDLDVPGADLDDAEELRGNEDEENNLYSLGGENHEDLEENRS